ncbi:hypothetical protein ACHAP5_008850 [Fusarium lateritium]
MPHQIVSKREVYIGVRGRVEYHIKQSQSKIPTVKQSRHYETICRPDTIPEFRVLGLFEVHLGNTIATTIAEQVIMIYLATISSTNLIQKQFKIDIRAAIHGLPDLAQHGLNRGRIKYDSDQVEGTYIGSSVAYKTYIGVRRRVEYHVKQSQKAWSQIPAVKKSRHYETICRADVTPEFRVLRLFKVHPGNTIATTIAE